MRTWFLSGGPEALVFSTNLRMVAESVDSVRIDRQYEDYFLIHGYYPRHATPYVGVEALPPARLRKIGSETATSLSVPVAPEPAGGQIVDGDELALIEQLYSKFMAALEAQSASTKRVGVLLGGFDSALVAAGLSRIGKDVETYSFSYTEESYNQPLVEDVAAYLDIKHHWVTFDHENIGRGLRDFTDVFNRPTNWPNYVIQTAELCREMVDNGLTQCFSGDGCDTIFLGYPGTYRRARVIGVLAKMPSPFFGGLLRLAARPNLERRLGYPYRVFLGLLRSVMRDEPARTFLSFRILDEISLGQLRRDVPPLKTASIDSLGVEIATPFAHLSSYRLAYEGKGAVSPNKNKMIGSADLSGLTIWSPYMHSSLKSFAMSLPDTLMRPDHRTSSNVTGKYILQRMAVEKGLLPDGVIFQKKVAAVDAPIDDWYANELRETLHDLWTHLPFDLDWDYADSLIEPKLAERLFREHMMVDKVITHAASLLATYGAFAAAADR